MEIIGVDHVQFAVRDVAAGASYLSRYGYELTFQEQDFNAQARPYYRGIRKDMAYLKRGASRVEMITGAEHHGHARYIPVFEALEPPHRPSALDLGGSDLREFDAFWHEDLSSVCASRNGEAPILDGVIVRTGHPDRSSAFWQFLGFELIGQDDRWYTLAYPRNMLSMPLTVLLARLPYDAGRDSRVDDLGCSSIALMTRNLRADRAALIAEDYAVSEATPFRINGKPLTVCFAAGPGGELVELLEMGRS
jgi:hypothetical protein